jgi:hypothetical protein
MGSLTLYYRVNNNGDGSVSCRFYESEELAEWLEESEIHLFSDGSWGESSVSWVTVEGDNLVCDELENKDTILIEYVMEYSEEHPELIANFVKTFYPAGVPKFDITSVPTSTSPEKYHNLVFKLDGVEVAKIFENKEKGVDSFYIAIAKMTEDLN